MLREVEFSAVFFKTSIQSFANSSILTFALGTNASTFEICDNSTIGTNTRLSITSAGNVGIGTTSPSAKLEVQTASSEEVTTGLLIHNNVGGTAAAGNGVGVVMGRAGGLYSSKIANVWTNSNPSYLQTNIAFYTMHNSYLAGSETEKMRLTSDGKVGIGTTSPGAKLDLSLIHISEPTRPY